MVPKLRAKFPQPDAGDTATRKRDQIQFICACVRLAEALPSFKQYLL